MDFEPVESPIVSNPNEGYSNSSFSHRIPTTLLSFAFVTFWSSLFESNLTKSPICNQVSISFTYWWLSVAAGVKLNLDDVLCESIPFET